MEKTNDYSFELSPLAAENITNITDYIADELKNKKAANDIAALLYDKIKKIICFPYSYPRYENFEFKNKKNVRKANVKSFVIFFEIDENDKKIIIVAIVHSKTLK